MIPYEDLCAALEAYAARGRGVSPRSVEVPTDHGYEITTDLPSHDDPLAQAAADPALDGGPLPEGLHPSIQAGDEESTHVGQLNPAMSPVYEDHSNELDIGDVLSDEDANN